MVYNIGDIVVRHCLGKCRWDMVGIITAKRPHKDRQGESYHTIKWFDPNKNTGSTTWQAHEFVSIETVKKLTKVT